MEPSSTAALRQLIELMLERSASDLHVTTGTPPQLRIDGRLTPIDQPPLGPGQTRDLCYSILTPQQQARFEEEQELDFSLNLQGLSRVRVNLYRQRGAVAGAFRPISYQIPSLEELGLPPVVRDLVRRPRGLVLVTGPTGCGKSTTLASMVDRINSERREHILTVEDPIEYLHPHKKSVVNQRELGMDTRSYARALKHVLRQDPDVVLIGEMRDTETIEAVLNISETGHLVLATLHTSSAVQTINRIIDIFPSNQQTQVRIQLSFVLEGVISQQLLPRSTGSGRVLAAEALIPTPAIRNLIREEKTHMIATQMQLGQAKFGMQTMNQSLTALYLRGLVGLEEALSHSAEPEELRSMITSAASKSI